MAHMPDLGRMAKLNVDTLSKKNYKKKTKGVANEQRMVIFIVKIDEPHLVEVQVHMEHVLEKGKKEEMTTHWSEHKVKESNIDEVVASTKSTALKMACEAAKNIHPNWFNSEVFLTTSVVVDGNWYDGDEGTARLTDNDGLATIQTVVF